MHTRRPYDRTTVRTHACADPSMNKKGQRGEKKGEKKGGKGGGELGARQGRAGQGAAPLTVMLVRACVAGCEYHKVSDRFCVEIILPWHDDPSNPLSYPIGDQLSPPSFDLDCL